MSREERDIQKQKKKRNRFIFRSSILVVLVGAVIFALFSNSKDEDEIYRAGDAAPDFQLTQVNDAVDEDVTQLSDFEGKGVMLNFWATWCGPCKDEMPYMQELYPKYKEKGVEIVAVSLDGTELVIDNFIEDYGLTFAIPHDTNSDVRDLYRIRPMPTTFFINPDGTINEVVQGALTLERLEGHLDAITPDAS
ncbi:thiol-disulfide oxidoreductase ResA [Oceanobacillus oncorhynchi subsp. incaldanensis]|uniref:Thiol-disulfide oxidoreductase ResA n=2 Tax=Oceanobacillus TaxID=182709 RepID=A0A0A1MEL5_9BACI|nr:thiol-disulfide oxidoreductase ResA [Oceanobacillus oncorhynchi]MDM8101636.1 thiol-disulfide oxidoreductase ResA [Oceanobacillus oncorhynchi]UUI38129.1 thiol-disulfide oxidoreductase ResA [Oceanobacillus oncorhynchi]GIO17165.1 thiol-disulfide oxidoreductase ResA [Oceanobacillus oncorhynchi subsp. incaldanensis]CEI83785.1 Thiol-disulfide oxidoreductase ResA [Oceanobacillus oncorhynchi]